MLLMIMVANRVVRKKKVASVKLDNS